MALCVCKCLNIVLECEKYEDVIDVGLLNITTAEQRDLFFSEKLLSSTTNSMSSQVAQPALLGQHNVGRWTVHTCLSCRHTTHAVLHDQSNIVLINKANITTREKVKNLKNSSNFSLVFNLLVPEVTDDIEMKENIDTNNFVVSENNDWVPTQQVISTLSKQLSKALQTQLETIEEAVRQFRDQKFAEYEVYREKAHRDQKILASIISKARSSESAALRVDATLDNGPPSPLLAATDKRRRSSLKDTKKITQHIVKPNRSLPTEEDSLEAEDLFDLEGDYFQPNMASDQDDYDSDEVSDDEGIHVPRRPQVGVAMGVDIARSLPVNMPNFQIDRHTPRDFDDDQEETQDIAASIKALARSVHGDAFDLPRPRFTTQI